MWYSTSSISNFCGSSKNSLDENKNKSNKDELISKLRSRLNSLKIASEKINLEIKEIQTQINKLENDK
jgi:hypothetical protein